MTQKNEGTHNNGGTINLGRKRNPVTTLFLFSKYYLGCV